MSIQKPKFKQGHMIQSGGAPSEVYLVTNVQTNTDGRGHMYELETPTGERFERAAKDIDPYHRRNAREFNRQWDAANASPQDPDFDKDGTPTAEFFRKLDERKEDQ